ncbi:uncharacterized protein LOC113391211 [Ctenocephalides felis]|uniref:uncharacterized protein LOC113391211 n=1 Tax=Ctenocephalides felis TaxID=7515 RepID=UPI000E6E27C9|nr:uncharacterized protein LOC113391211 [Ctenocephalides felis]
MTSVFIIPAKKSDLVESDNEFCVRRKLRIENLSNDCRELTRNFGESDLEDYIQHFLDVYYYVTKHLGALDWKYITFYSETLRKVWSQLNTKLDLYFTKKMYNDVNVLNETKIVLYITNGYNWRDFETSYNVEGLSQEDKEIRDGLLEDLYDMLHDVAAGIRSKVLQVFAKLLKDSALPLSWLLKIMDRSVGRLCDKGILVRKNAIVVLKEFIKNRPSDVPMDNDVLHQSLQNAIEKLASLREQPHQADLEKIKMNAKPP